MDSGERVPAAALALAAVAAVPAGALLVVASAEEGDEKHAGIGGQLFGGQPFAPAYFVYPEEQPVVLPAMELPIEHLDLHVDAPGGPGRRMER